MTSSSLDGSTVLALDKGEIDDHCSEVKFRGHIDTWTRVF